MTEKAEPFTPPVKLAVTTSANALRFRTGELSYYIRFLRSNPEINTISLRNGADRIASSDFPKEFFKKSGYPSHYQFIGLQEPFFIYRGCIYVSSMPDLWPIKPEVSEFKDAVLMNREMVHTWLHMEDVTLVRVKALSEQEIHLSGYTSRTDFESTYRLIKFSSDQTLQFENNPYVWLLELSAGPKYLFDGIQKYRINARKRHEQQLYPERQYKITEPTNAIYPMPASKIQIETFGDLAENRGEI